jgi:hypothetical protein
MLDALSTPHIAHFWGLVSDAIYKEKKAIGSTTLLGHHSSSELLGRPSMKKAAAIWYSDLGVRKLIEGALRTAGLMKLDNQCIDCKSAHTIAAARHI